MPGAKHYVFTLNNYSNEDEAALAALSEGSEVSYLVFGREVAPTTNTPHLQGYVAFLRRKTLGQARILIPRAHLEVAHGTPKEAASYCKKDGNFEEFGELPGGQGKRNDWVALQDWTLDLGRLPTKHEFAVMFPRFYASHDWQRLVTIMEATLLDANKNLLPPVEGTPRDWQVDLWSALQGECEDTRSILFYVDPDGNKGKSWFCRYVESRMSTRCQVLGVGKRDDMAYMIDESKDVFLLDVPRSQSEFLQYSVLEMLKDRRVTSPKYASCVKHLRVQPHVVVFLNEQPDMSKLSDDRYIITNI